MSISLVSSAFNLLPQIAKSPGVADKVQRLSVLAQQASNQTANDGQRPNTVAGINSKLNSFVPSNPASIELHFISRANVGTPQSIVNYNAAGYDASIQSKSSIIDVDVAKETANLTLFQIKQQAAVAVLSQANSQPQIVLSLLNGR